MNKKEMYKEVESFENKLKELEKLYIPIARAHFLHQARNRLNNMSLVAQDPHPGKEDFQHYSQEKNLLVTYLDLIENNPNFRDKEFHTEEGFFPEADKQKLPYIKYAKEHL